jgi:ParB/RepB/Spo0J family partition protein
MSEHFPVATVPDLSPLGMYFQHSDWLPDDAMPEKRAAVIAARACGEVEFLLIRELTDPEQDSIFADVFKQIKDRKNALAILKAALLVEKAWSPRFFAVCALKEAIKNRENEETREAAIEALTEIVSAEVITEDAIPGPNEELEPIESGSWTVITDGEFHCLTYAGKERARLRGHHGLETLERMAAQFRKSGSHPGRKARPRCAIDAANPDTYLAKHANSPELPFSSPQTENTEPTKTMAKAKALTPLPVESELPMVEKIPASQFRRYPSNRQILPDQIAKMADSIREVGVIQPITARQVDNLETGGIDLEIIIGECRWLGCCDIDPNYEVPCFVRIGMTDKEAARIHTIENFQRKDLDEIEEARAIQHLKDTGWTIDEIMQFLGRSKDSVYNRLRLLDLDEAAHTAIREGSISLHTAVKLASLPEEKRAEALEAIVHPVHAAKALPERQALELIDRDFIEPEKKAKEWEKRKKAILENNPNAKWNTYQEAKRLDKWDSGFKEAEDKPSYQICSDAARSEELVIPTWGELAIKHGAQFHIGCGYDDEAAAYVETAPLIDAEKAACDDKPGDCIFPHEAAIAQLREESARRKMEQEAHHAAVNEELKRLAQLIIAPEAVSKTASRKLVEVLFLEKNLAPIFNIQTPEADSEVDFTALVEAAISKYLKSKTMNPFEAMGRLQIADGMLNGGNRYTSQAFETNAIKAGDFPALHKNYLEWKKRMEEIEKRSSANSNQDAA